MKNTCAAAVWFLSGAVVATAGAFASRASNTSAWDAASDATELAEFLSQRNEAVRWAIDRLKPTEAELQVRGMEFFDVRGGELMAIRVLRELRAGEGAQFLMPFVDVRTPQVAALTTKHEVNLGDWYPAAGALAAIGRPSLDFCLPALAMPASQLKRQNLCWVIGEIHGAEVGRYVLELAIRDEMDATRKASLSEVLKVYDAVWDPEDDSLRRPREPSHGMFEEEPIGEAEESRAPSR